MHIQFDDAEIKRIVMKAILEVQERFDEDDRLAFVEADAAKLISVKKHVLRDERLKGRIHPGKSGRSWLYSRKMLLKYVEQNMGSGE